MPALLVIKDILLLTLQTLSASIALITQTEHQMLKTYSLLDESLMNHVVDFKLQNLFNPKCSEALSCSTTLVEAESHSYDMQWD